MSETPVREGRSSRVSSRSATPHRRRSKTPVRTPTRRRRATIVSANLVQSRRQHRQSISPQNILRSLSRALVREREADQQQQQQQQQQQSQNTQQDETPETRPQTPLREEDELPVMEASPERPQQETNEPAVNEEFVDYGDFDYQEDLDRVQMEQEQQQKGDSERPTLQPSEIPQLQPTTSSLLPDDIQSQRARQSEAPRSTLFSDIALPEGIMPDEDMDRDYDVTREPLSDPFNDQSNLHSEIHAPPTPPHTVVKKPRIGSRKPRTTTNPLASRSVFKYAQACTKKTIASECAPLLAEISGEFFDNMTEDLVAYAQHSKSKDTINSKCAFLLLKRQRLVGDLGSLEDLVDEVMPLEDVLELRRNMNRLRK